MHTIVGTPYYVAPEVLKGNYDFKCDVWSLGVILYIMLCGYPPFEGDNNKEIFKRVLQQQLDYDPEDWDLISEEAKDLIGMMLMKDPVHRISAIDCLNHKWFDISHPELVIPDKKIIMRIRDFNAP
jgi:calcium-dependent protein kinase